MISPYILVIISPFFYAAMNVFDKFIVEHKVKNYQSYAVIDGIVLLLTSIIISLFLDWSKINIESTIFPIIIGLCSGLVIWLYYYLLNKEDVSHTIGIIYIYPIFVAVLSFIFIGEKISILGYIGMLITVLGAVLLSVRLKNLKVLVILSLIGVILLDAIGEFLVKISTSSIPEFNAIMIVNFTLGLMTILIGVSIKKIRKGIKSELKNIKYSSINFCFWLIAIISLFYAMDKLPATIVSSFCATQPLFVLMLERIINKFIGKISKDNNIIQKLGAIFLVIFGIILLYVSEFFVF